MENMFEETYIIYHKHKKQNKYANIQDIIITNHFTKILLPPNTKTIK